MDETSRLKPRPEFVRQLATCDPEEQDAILDTVERLATEALGPEEISFALGITMSARPVPGHRISVCFRALENGDISVLYVWRWPRGIPIM